MANEKQQTHVCKYSLDAEQLQNKHPECLSVFSEAPPGGLVVNRASNAIGPSGTVRVPAKDRPPVWPLRVLILKSTSINL